MMGADLPGNDARTVPRTAYSIIGKSVMGKAVYFDFRPYSCGFRRLAENLLLKIVYISGFYPAFSWRKYTRNR